MDPEEATVVTIEDLGIVTRVNISMSNEEEVGLLSKMYLYLWTLVLFLTFLVSDPLKIFSK